MCSCYVPDRPCFPPFPLLPGWQTVAQANHAEAASVWAVFNVANLQYDISLFDTSSSGSHVSCGSCPWCGGGCSRDVSPNLHPQTRHVTRNWAAWKQRCKNCQGHKTLKQQRKHTFGCDLLVFQEGIHFKFQTFSLICPCPNLASDSFIKSISHLFLFSSPNRKSFLWQKQSSKSLQGTERLKMKRTVARMSWANQFLDVVRLFHIFLLRGRFKWNFVDLLPILPLLGEKCKNLVWQFSYMTSDQSSREVCPHSIQWKPHGHVALDRPWFQWLIIWRTWARETRFEPLLQLLGILHVFQISFVSRQLLAGASQVFGVHDWRQCSHLTPWMKIYCFLKLAINLVQYRMSIDKFALASVCGNLVDVFVNSENITFHNVSLRGAGFIPRLLMDSYHVKSWFPIQFCWGKAQQRLGGDVSWIWGLKNTKANTPIYHVCWVLRTQKKRLQTCSDAQPGLTRCFKRFFQWIRGLFLWTCMWKMSRWTWLGRADNKERHHTSFDRHCLLAHCQEMHASLKDCDFYNLLHRFMSFPQVKVQKVCHPAAASISFLGTGGSGLPSGRAGLEASCISRVLSYDERKNTSSSW